MSYHYASGLIGTKLKTIVKSGWSGFADEERVAPPILTPLGHRRVKWDDVENGQTVRMVGWLKGAEGDEIRGPFTVYDARRRQLVVGDGTPFSHYPEDLLVRDDETATGHPSWLRHQ